MIDDPASTRPKAVPLGTSARVAFGAGALLFAGAIATILLCFAGPWPDLLLGVLGVGVLICGILAIIGRLPSGFEVAGLRFHFEAEELSNLISTVRSALDTDPDERDEILRLIKQGTGPKAFREAASLSAAVTAGSTADTSGQPQTTSGSDEGAESAPVESGGRSQRDIVRSALEEAFPASEIQERFSVPTGSRGKRPIFDFYVESAQLVVEVERYWNDSTVDLVSRKSTRALEKVTPVATVVVVTPQRGVARYRTEIDNDAVLVIALEELTPNKLLELIGPVEGVS